VAFDVAADAYDHCMGRYSRLLPDAPFTLTASALTARGIAHP
jgi:hypothetical protein